MLWLRLYEQISVQNRRFHSNEGRLNQNFRLKGLLCTSHSFSRKTRLNDFSNSIKICPYFSFRFVTIHAFDALAMRKLSVRAKAFSSLDRVCMQCGKSHFMPETGDEINRSVDSAGKSLKLPPDARF